MGSHHLGRLAKRKDVEVAYVCDVDQNRLAKAARLAEAGSGKAPKAVKDLRQVLDDRSVDAVCHRHAGSLARPGRDPGPGRRQARLRREALLPQHPRRPADDRGRRARGKRLQVGTQTRSTACVHGPCSCSAKGAIGESWSPRPGTASSADHRQAKPSNPPARPQLRHCGSARPRWCPTRQPTARHLALVVQLRHRRHRQRRRPRYRHRRWGLASTRSPRPSPAWAASTSSTTTRSSPTRSTSSSNIPSPAAGQKQLIFEQRIWSPYVQEGYSKHQLNQQQAQTVIAVTLLHIGRPDALLENQLLLRPACLRRGTRRRRTACRGTAGRRRRSICRPGRRPSKDASSTPRPHRATSIS